MTTIARPLLSSLLLVLLVAVSSHAKEDDKSDRGGRDFANKIVAVNYKSGKTHTSAVLKKVRPGKIGNRDFLVGEFVFDATDENADYDGVEAWIPADKIDGLMVFQDLDAARRIVEKAWQPSEDEGPRMEETTEKASEAPAAPSGPEVPHQEDCEVD